MELSKNDKSNLEDLLHIITGFISYQENNPKCNKFTTLHQPILFNKPKKQKKWNAPDLVKNSVFVLTKSDYDNDLIWYTQYLLHNQSPVVIHDVLDWQLIAVSAESVADTALDSKIYVNTNEDSEMFGFYVLAPGDSKENFANLIIATDDKMFQSVWKIIAENPKIPAVNLINRVHGKCLLDNYYRCSESELIIKKKKICSAFGLEFSNQIYVSIWDCGICYQVMIEKGNTLVLGGDLFYSKITDKFITPGRSPSSHTFVTWGDSFLKLSKYADL